MQDLTEPILELIRLAATDLPPDVESALRESVEREEPGSAARGALETILKNVELSAPQLHPHLPGHRHANLLCALPRGLEHTGAAHPDRGCGGGGHQTGIPAP